MGTQEGSQLGTHAAAALKSSSAQAGPRIASVLFLFPLPRGGAQHAAANPRAGSVARNGLHHRNVDADTTPRVGQDHAEDSLFVFLVLRSVPRRDALLQRHGWLPVDAHKPVGERVADPVALSDEARTDATLTGVPRKRGTAGSTTGTLRLDAFWHGSPSCQPDPS